MTEIGIESTLVEAIKNGEKTIELCLAEPRFLKLQEDDVLDIREDFYYEGTILESLTHALEVKITQVLYFESLQDAFDAISFEQTLPTAISNEDAVKSYRERFSIEDEREFGIIAFTIEPVEK